MCGKRHVVDQANCTVTDTGYTMSKAITCRCGHSSSEIKDMSKKVMSFDSEIGT